MRGPHDACTSRGGHTCSCGGLGSCIETGAGPRPKLELGPAAAALRGLAVSSMPTLCRKLETCKQNDQLRHAAPNFAAAEGSSEGAHRHTQCNGSSMRLVGRPL